MIYDAQLGSFVYFEYPNSLRKEAKKHFALKRGYFPYNFNFVKGHRGDLAQCSYCGRFLSMKQMTRDHIYPKSLGGIVTTTACYDCNREKKDLKPIEYGLWLMEQQGFMRL
jgi:5-methylcytosine-specific restriction endonuclease McrA